MQTQVHISEASPFLSSRETAVALKSRTAIAFFSFWLQSTSYVWRGYETTVTEVTTLVDKRALVS